MIDAITLPKTEIPVRGEFDVMVIGGGFAGICAAIAASRCGATTLLCEQLPFVGGNASTGLPMTTLRASGEHQEGEPLPIVVKGITLEIMENLAARGAGDNGFATQSWLSFDPDVFQLVVNRMLREANVTLLCHSHLQTVIRQGETIQAAVFLGNDGLFAYRGKSFVDASGDAVVARHAGLKVHKGRERDQKTQPMTLIFSVGNVDVARYLEAGGPVLIKQEWTKLGKQIPLCNPRSAAALSSHMEIPGRKGDLSFNVTRVIVDKGTDPLVLSQAEQDGRFQVEEFLEKLLKPRIPGFESSYISKIAHRIGVRETYRIDGEYVLSTEDVRSYRHFEDGIACNSYPIDIHSPTNGNSSYNLKDLVVGDPVEEAAGNYYTVPYRSLVAKGVDNLWAAGRCASASHEALGAIRVNGCAGPTGQAAGTAAALCASNHVKAKDLDPDLLRSTLVENGSFVG